MLHQPKLKLYNKYKKNNYWKNSKFTTFESNNKKYYFFYNTRFLSLNTFYKKKLLNKQCLKNYLGKLNERQFKLNLKNINNLEQRLDFNLYKSNLTKSIYMARFCISKGFILVNNTKINKPSYILKANDLIEINPKYWNSFNSKFNRSLNYLKNNDLYINYKTIYNIEVDYATLSFIYLGFNNYNLLNTSKCLKHQKNLKLNRFFIKKRKYINNYTKTIYFDDIYLQFIKRFYK